MAEYYQNLITEKSFKLLKQLKSQYQFILIGGWAVFFYTHSLKSKDIDIIIDFKELNKFKEKQDVFKNDRLKKYEISFGEFDVDIYLLFYSQFCLPVEVIQKHITSLEGFTVPQPEVLLILKQQAYRERRGSIKGEKDKLDILTLLDKVALDFRFYVKLSSDYQLSDFKGDLITLLKETSEAKELNLNKHQFSQLKKQVISQLSNFVL